MTVKVLEESPVKYRMNSLAMGDIFVVENGEVFIVSYWLDRALHVVNLSSGKKSYFPDDSVEVHKVVVLSKMA